MKNNLTWKYFKLEFFKHFHILGITSQNLALKEVTSALKESKRKEIVFIVFVNATYLSASFTF